MDKSIWNQVWEHLMIIDENHAIIKSYVEYVHLFTPLYVGGVVFLTYPCNDTFTYRAYSQSI